MSADELADALLQPPMVERVLATLSPRERAALQLVQHNGGQLAAAVLEREFGVVREHAQYPNQRAYLLALEQPPSPTERLFVLGMLLPVREPPRMFGPGRVIAYAIPNDLLPLLPAVPLRDNRLRLSDAGAPPEEILADLPLAERFLMALLQLGRDGLLEVIPSGGLNKASLVRFAKWRDPKDSFKGAWREEHWPYVSFLRRVAEGAGLLRLGADSLLRPTREALDWMQMPPPERARTLLQGWVDGSWDELVHVLGMKVQRGFGRDLPGAKQAILDLLGQLPPNQWVTFDEFVEEVRRAAPDFARPDGVYDSWGLVNYMRQPLDGFEHWPDVEGQQLRAITGSTLRWLGLCDMGASGEEALSFRLNALGAALLSGTEPPAYPPPEPLVIQPNFEVIAPALAQPYARFQLGRVAVRTPGNDLTEIYTLTKKSIQMALERDISYEDIIRFLADASGRDLPQNVLATLREWAGQYGQVSMRSVVLLEAKDSAMLQQLRSDKRLRMPEAEELTEHAWVLRPADQAGLAERLRKAGYGLSDNGAALDTPLQESDLAVIMAALQFYAAAGAQIGVEGGASAAMLQRVARLLPEKQLNRAHQVSYAALQRLKEYLQNR